MQLAKERQERDLKEGPSRGLFFDEEKADRAVAFFEGNGTWSGLKHWKGEWAGQTFKLAWWQRDLIIRPVFGWMREDGTRRFRFATVFVPRKNGKTTMAAGMGLYLTAADNEPAAEVYSSATKLDQAKLMWGDAKMMMK